MLSSILKKKKTSFPGGRIGRVNLKAAGKELADRKDQLLSEQQI